EALVDAETAVKRYPESALLRRRLAQAYVCQALQLDGQFEQTAEDLAFGALLPQAVESLRNPPTLTGEHDPAKIEAARKLVEAVSKALLTHPVLASLTAFQQRAGEELKASGPLLEQRSRALSDAFAAVKVARRLGDASTELELTDLWA